MKYLTFCTLIVLGVTLVPLAQGGEDDLKLVKNTKSQKEDGVGDVDRGSHYYPTCKTKSNAKHESTKPCSYGHKCYPNKCKFTITYGYGFFSGKQYKLLHPVSIKTIECKYPYKKCAYRCKCYNKWCVRVVYRIVIWNYRYYIVKLKVWFPCGCDCSRRYYY